MHIPMAIIILVSLYISYRAYLGLEWLMFWTIAKIRVSREEAEIKKAASDLVDAEMARMNRA